MLSTTGKRLELLVACKFVVESVWSYSPFLLTDRNNVDTLVRLEINDPFVFWHTCYNVVLAEGPILSDVRVLNPYIPIFCVPLYV